MNNDRLEGLVTVWNEEGELTETSYYKNDICQRTTGYTKGRLHYDTLFKNDHQHINRIWNEKGNMIHKIYYNKHGHEFRWSWDDKGKVTWSRHSYFDLIKTSKIKLWYLEKKYTLKILKSTFY